MLMSGQHAASVGNITYMKDHESEQYIVCNCWGRPPLHSQLAFSGEVPHQCGVALPQLFELERRGSSVEDPGWIGWPGREMLGPGWDWPGMCRIEDHKPGTKCHVRNVSDLWFEWLYKLHSWDVCPMFGIMISNGREKCPRPSWPAMPRIWYSSWINSYIMDGTHRDRSYHCHGVRFGSRETEKTSWDWVSHAIPIV